MALLQTEGLTVRFGGVQALDSVDVTVDGGGIVGLIGPNGAGKTTFIDAVAGAVPASSGRVLFRDEDLTDTPPFDRANRGLVRTFQTLELYEDLTVEQNLVAGAESAPWWGFLVDAVRPRRSAAANARVDEVLRLVDLEDARHHRPPELSHGHRGLVGLARALAARPQLLLLDEPAAGLDTIESARLGDVLRTISDSGITILLVDHDTSLVFDVSDRVYVLDFGTVIACGPPEEVRSDPAVVAAYLGEVTS